MVFDQAGQHYLQSGTKDGPKNVFENLFKTADLKLGILLFVAYLIIAIVVFAPLSSRMATVAPGSGGDTYQNLWDIWWIGYSTFALHTSFYSTNLLYWPIGANLAYQTMAPIASLIFVPFQAVNLQFAYNVMLLVGFALSGLTMFILSDYVVKNKTASFIAGVVFAFSAFHIAQAYAHIDWINIGWVPLAIYFFMRIVHENGGFKNALGLGASFVLITFMGDIEQSIELLLAISLMLAAYVIFNETRKKIMNKKFITFIVLAAFIAFILGAWGFIPIIGAISQPGGLSQANQLNNVTYSSIWSTNLGTFLIPSYYNGLFDTNPGSYFNSTFGPDPTETVAYIGYGAILFTSYGIYSDYKKKDYKRSGLWIGLAVIFGLLSMGPSAGLYLIYHLLGPFNVIREPGRFDLIFSMAMAILVAFGFNDIQIKINHGENAKRNVMLLAIAFVLILIIENNGIAISASLLSQVTTHAHIPVFYSALANVSGNFSVLELPVMPNQYSSQPGLYEAEDTYYVTASHKPIVGGDITRSNTTQELSLYSIPIVPAATALQQNATLSFLPSPVNQDPGNESILSLRQLNTAFITVNLDAYSKASSYVLTSYLESLFGTPVYADNQTVVFSTLNATMKPTSSLYRAYKSFVMYPSLTQWHQINVRVNGTTEYLWTPAVNASALYGEMLVFAPYANQSNANFDVMPASYPIPAKIRFQATTSFGKANLSIDALNSAGSLTQLASIPISNGIGPYVANVTLSSGPTINTLIFIQNVGGPSFNGTEQLILLRNITITK